MSKLLVALFVTSFGMAAGFFAGPRILYSGLQGQIPFGTAVKVTPDGSNVWAWHHTFTRNESMPVVVDFDSNGRMDTENACFRVMITDMQVAFPQGLLVLQSLDKPSIEVIDDTGVRWDLLPAPVLRPFWYTNHSTHLTTPLVLPVRSKLAVVVGGMTLTGQTISIILVGKLTNL